ncbi:MAG: efflux transporter, family, subunit [Anaeromyxobacteraceae bacterium]|jgi:cobalt-zinc-cadmium efflux system membrane fusion protein|nr:efflux transporter, family, subunit [Anaeromyxobacteraceae bacterium]
MNRLALTAALAVLVACRPSPAPAPPRAEAGHAHEHEGHEGAKPSDLDRPVEELFAETCEHDRKAHACDECRYQVGVVRVPEDLLKEGLVKTSTVARRPLETPVPLTGEVRFAERKVTHLSPRAEGVIRKVLVALGEKVTAGQPLLEMESATLGEAESSYLESEATLRLSRKALDRQAALREEGISSEKEFLAARQEAESAGIRAQAASDRLRRLGLGQGEIDGLGKAGPAGVQGRLVLRAPAAGTILDMHAVPGEAARPDQNVFTIGDLSQMWVWADVYEGQVRQVLAHEHHGDMRATVTAKAFPGEVFPASVDFVAPSMDEKTRTLKVRVGVPNPKGKLRAGMFVNVELYLPSGPDALVIPRAALLADEGRSFVFVRHQGEYWVRRPVETGRASGGQVEITKGLAGGETVATEGCFLLKSDVLRSKMGAGCAD